jgi:hypothetical protein
MAILDYYVSIPGREVVQGELTDSGMNNGTAPANTNASYTTDKTAFEAALATLVADGASPTQAHVTAANSAYTTFKGDLVAPGTDFIELRFRITDPSSNPTNMQRRDVLLACEAFKRYVIDGGQLGTGINLPVS